MTDTTRIALASRPDGEPTADNFRTETVTLPAPETGQVLLRTIYLSLDPYMRGRMSDAESYATPMSVNDTVVGGTVCEVIESQSERVSAGDIVLAYTGWQTHAVVSERALRPIDATSVPISAWLGVLGMPGFTAYAGLTHIGQPQPGETVVVAAAAGPVGSAVGQIAQIYGARAVGIAGGPEKVAWLREIGFDAAVDHRSASFADDLADATGGGIDVYFENVGGAVWNTVLPRLNKFARVPVCGLVSQYNANETPAGPDLQPRMMNAILIKSLRIRGFIQDEFRSELLGEFEQNMSSWVDGGRVQYREHRVDGLENAPAAFAGMLNGTNFGKMVVQIGSDPT